MNGSSDGSLPSPFSSASGFQLVFRPWRWSDIDDLWRAASEPGSHLPVTLGWAKRAIESAANAASAEEADILGRRSLRSYVVRRVCGHIARSPHALISYVLVDGETNTLFGSPSGWMTERPGIAEIGLWVRYPRQGLGREMVAYLESLMFRTLRPTAIELSVHPDNTAMIGLARSLGYRDSGVVERSQVGNPQPFRERSRLFVLTAAQWHVKHRALVMSKRVV